MLLIIKSFKFWVILRFQFIKRFWSNFFFTPETSKKSASREGNDYSVVFLAWSWLSLTCVVEAAISGPTEIKYAVEGKAMAEKGGRTDNYCRPIKGRLVAASVMLLDFYERNQRFSAIALAVRFSRFLSSAFRACSPVFSLSPLYRRFFLSFQSFLSPSSFFLQSPREIPNQNSSFCSHR